MLRVRRLLLLLFVVAVPSSAAQIRRSVRMEPPSPRTGTILPITDLNLSNGARLSTSLTPEQLDSAIRQSGVIDRYDRRGRPVRRNMRVVQEAEGLAVEPDQIYSVTGSGFTEVVNKRLKLLPTILRLARQRLEEGRRLAVLDWGAGSGRTLATLKEELERRGVTNVDYLGYSNQYFPQWEKAPEGIRFLFDTPENLPRHLRSPDGQIRPVDVVYSHYGLDLMVNSPQKAGHFALLRGLLAKDGEILATNMRMPLDDIRALGFETEKIPVRREVWNKAERERWKMSAYRFRRSAVEKPAKRHYWVWKDGGFVLSEVPGRYAGWRKGKIFGLLTHRTPMKPENRVFFHTWNDAIRAGYRPCKVCKPRPDWDEAR